ncbi:hypothetical protein BDV12DRAFT_160711 [Aspergillus spectabilis]
MASNDNETNSRPPDSPQSQPPPPPRSRNPSALDLNRSNSTANLFLGGARKSWMSTANNNNNIHSSATAPTSSIPPVPALPALPPAPPIPPPPPSCVSSADCSSAPTTPPVAVSSPPLTRPEGMPISLPNLPSHLQQSLPSVNSNNATGASSNPETTQNVLPNRPPMPSASNTPPLLTCSPASHPQFLPARPEQPLRYVDARLQQRQKQQLQQSQLQAHLQRQSASSLPSPDPTIRRRSHTSPSAVLEGNGPAIPSPSTAALPSPPHQQAPPVRRGRPRKNAPAVGTGPVSLPSNRQGRNNPPAIQGNARPGESTPPNHPHPTPAVPSRPPPQPQPQAPTPPDGRLLAIDNEFFMRAKLALDATSMLMSESVEAPRMQLLIYACTEQDLFYLALHQVYCMSSYAPSQFNGLPGITPRLLQGLEVVQNLLVDNTRVSNDFLKWCMDFPYPMFMLLKVQKYQDAFHQVVRVLNILVDRWNIFEHNVRVFQHPPLVDDMVKQLEVVSPVLQYSIWLCLCRRLPHVKIEGPLQEIFMQNVDNFKRYRMGMISENQQRIENDRVVFLYNHAIAQMGGQVGPPPREAAQEAAQAPRRPPASQAVSAHVPAPATLATTHNALPSPVPPYSPAHVPTGIVPASVRSPPVAGPQRARPQSSLQLQTQQRVVGTQGIQSPVTAAVSSPLMATARSPIIQREMPQGHSHQQHSQHPPQARPQTQRAIHQQPHPAQVPAGHRLPSSNLQYAPQQQRRTTTMLLPQPNVPPVINTRPNPNRLAIHQAHLRDSVNQFISVNVTGSEDTELLPHVTSFVVEPEPLRQPKRAFKWQFSLSERELKHRPCLQPQGKGQRMHRIFKEGDQSYRLRCIKVPRSTAKVSEHSWCVAETVWPCAIYMSVNGSEVFPRRKLHNGKNFPLDITAALQEGVNNVTVHFILGAAEQKDFTYAMAVEVLTFSSPTQAKALTQHLSAAESRERMCGRLVRNSSTEDDELCIVSDDLKVSLVDPYTARLFVVPVRGCHCEHLECFDHETFIQTHALKSGDRSALEADWRCPICRQDARPQSLVVDGFLTEVRKELERTNRCDGARALQIKADGTWEVQTEEDIQSSNKGTHQPQHTGLKRQASVLESGLHKRPKVDRSASIPETVASQSSAVIILD